METIFQRAQEIAVISPDTAEVIDTITDTKEIENFVSVLDLDQWELKTLQMKRLKSVLLDSHKRNNQTGADEHRWTLYDIATITLVQWSYISFEIGGFDMTFEVSEDTADYLNGYFE